MTWIIDIVAILIVQQLDASADAIVKKTEQVEENSKADSEAKVWQWHTAMCS